VYFYELSNRKEEERSNAHLNSVERGKWELETITTGEENKQWSWVCPKLTGSALEMRKALTHLRKISVSGSAARSYRKDNRDG